MTVLKYEKLEQYVSEPRLGKYLNACDNSKTQAKKLYSANLRICQSFYPILNLFEIFVRNSVNVALTNHFNDSNWIITEKAGFMSDSSLTQSRFYLKRCVEKAIRNNGANSSAGKIISDQTFGFWSALFLPHHYQLLQGSVIDSFPNKSANVNRGVIHNNLKKINIFRNRVYANPAIHFRYSSLQDSFHSIF